nr:hypothetical protein CFP56_30172 [Quercus suber]
MAVEASLPFHGHHLEDHDGPPTKARSTRTMEEPSHLPSPMNQPPREQDLDGSGASPPVLHLSQVVRLLRSRDHHRRRSLEIQDRLRALQVASAHTNRLLHIAQTVQHTLAECIKSEDKQSFSNLFNAFLDASDRASTSPCREREPSPAHHVGYRASVLDLTPASNRASLLDLCYRVRYDGNYIADCLASLTHKELLGILPDHTSSGSAESVLVSSSWHNFRKSRHLGFVVDGQMELLQSSECACPLHTLFHFGPSISANPTAEDSRISEVWATVCARLIADPKPGSEKVVPAVLDLVAFRPGWNGKSRLERWILQTLEKGAFLVEQPSKQSFRTRVLGRSEISVEDQSAIDSFYSDSVSSLLDMLGDNEGPSVIPHSVLKICHSISAKLDSNLARQRAFPQFVITRKHGSVPSVEVTSKVQTIVTRLTSSPELQDPSERRVDDGRSCQTPDNEVFAAVTMGELVSVVKALFPQRRPVSFTFDGESASSGLHSSSSSISGFSLFQSTTPSHVATSSPSGTLRNGTEDPTQTMPGSLDTLTDLKQAHRISWMESHGESLREACAAMEEIRSGYDKTFGSWNMLLMNYEDHSTTTTLAELERTSTAGVERKMVTTMSNDRRRCAKAVEDFLLTRPTFDTISQRDWSKSAHHVPQIQQALLREFQDLIVVAEQRGDFLEAYSWSQKLHDLRRVITGEHPWQLQSVLNEIYDLAMLDVSKSKAIIDACDRWISLLEPVLESSMKQLTAAVEISYQMRNKMWFVADVRTSAAYEAARSVANALRIMAKPKRQQRPQVVPPLRHWSAAKLTSGQLHLKSDAQVLELLSTSPLQGGPNKLSDDQSKATAQWMENNNVENLCQGEERLHRLCMEIRKCIEHLMSGSNATFCSGPLFARDKPHETTSASPSLAVLQSSMGGRRPLTLRTNVQTSMDSISSASHPLSSASSRDYMDAESSAATHRSSAAFWSPTTTEYHPPSSSTSVGSVPTQFDVRGSVRERNRDLSSGSAQRIEGLRKSLTSLLLSDIASPLFSEGSETDRAYWTGISGVVSERHLRTLRRTTDRDLRLDSASSDPEPTFDFKHAYASLLHRFSVTTNPYSKLKDLHELDELLSLQAIRQSGQATPSIPVMPDLLASSRKYITLQTVDANVLGFRELFCDGAIRPAAIFRDMQYIAALVPSTLLETTPQGKAFWNAGVALLGLKQELRTVMVETADSIIAYHSNNRGHGRSASTAQLERDSAIFSTPSRTPSAEDIARYSMSDAACMLQITAREGDRVAQRELATLYLTHPELMDHILAPFTRPKDVFREELENKWRKNQDPDRCDPVTMCVAHHWMSLSSKAGDGLANEFLKQREELSDF